MCKLFRRALTQSLGSSPLVSGKSLGLDVLGARVVTECKEPPLGVRP